jgi:hypothetical protein
MVTEYLPLAPARISFRSTTRSDNANPADSLVAVVTRWRLAAAAATMPADFPVGVRV